MSTALVTWRDSVGFEYTDRVSSENIAQFTADIDASQGAWVSETWTMAGRRVVISRPDDCKYFRLVVIGSHDAHFEMLEDARAAIPAQVQEANGA